MRNDIFTPAPCTITLINWMPTEHHSNKPTPEEEIMNTTTLSLSSSSSSLFQHQRRRQCCKLLTSTKTVYTINATVKASLSISDVATNASSPAPLLTPHTKTSTAKVDPKPAPNSVALTPINYLERAAVAYADCPAILYNDKIRTWAEVYTRCIKLASSIVSLGIRRGDVVSVVAPNIPAMTELHFAVPMSGAVLNTMNLRLDAHAVSNLLQHSGSKLVFADCLSESLVHEAISMFPSHLHRPVLVLVADDSCDTCATDAVDCCIDYESMVEGGDASFRWVRPLSEWDPITLNYTSGTTSSPKGVVHSHRSSFLISVDSLLEWSVPKQPVYLWTLPMFHANGWGYAWGMAAVGAVNVCLRRVDAPSIYQAIDKYKVTHMCGAPVVLTMLTNHPGVQPLKTPVHIMTAGAPPPAAVLGRAESLGFVISHGYGLTETGGLVVSCSWKREWDHLSGTERAKMKARQGVRTAAFGDMDVVDPESGESVARDGTTMGEIVLRGGSVMLGYLKDEEGTRSCMRENGWFYTGDVGVVHRDGYLEVKDRSKDVIICGGENLSSVEVEAVLYGHPAVNEAAVVARPDAFWGETPCAFVSLKAEAAEKPTEKEIREFCKARLPLYMVPRTVVFKAELPKTSTGKIQKFLLRNMATDLGKILIQTKSIQ